jgi:outer membrane protein assembly factor BamE (lipoprotein component of BamABCDE complex)
MRLALLFLVVCLLPAPALAQAPRPATPSFAQAERNAVDLKQGMTPQQVRELLGKPMRTAMKSSGPADAASQLQWIYEWNRAPQGSSERSLSIEFAARTAEEWTVNSWGWSIY